MQNIEATGCIKMIAAPDGMEPLWIRKAWVGRILPCFPYIGYVRDGVFQVPSGDETEDVERGVAVPQDQAIAILELMRNPDDPDDLDAAQWWKNLGRPVPGEYFFFNEEYFIIVRGVFDVLALDYEDIIEVNPSRILH